MTAKIWVVESFWKDIKKTNPKHTANLLTFKRLELKRLFFGFDFSAIPLGIIVVRGDCDLETCRMYIDRLQEVRFFVNSGIIY